MERASNSSPNEYMKEKAMALQVNAPESISTNSSPQANGPDSARPGAWTVDTVEVEVLDVTAATSEEDCFPTEAPLSAEQGDQELTSAIVGCRSWEEVILNVSGLVSRLTKSEVHHQKEKEMLKLHTGGTRVDKVNKPPVIQLLGVCDQNTQLGLFQNGEDAAETGTWRDSVNRSNSSKMTEQEQSDCAKDIIQQQEYQELGGIPEVVSDFFSNQVLMQQVGRRYRRNRRGIVSTTRVVLPQLSSEEIRIKVCNTLTAILLHRLQEANDLNINEDTVQATAISIEKELFLLFFCTNARYKNKYRSLMFNLQDRRNTHLFRQVLLGEITAQCLVLMSPTELASLELIKWREHENKCSIKLITTKSEEFERQPLTKLTHKGEIEIERDNDQNLTLEDLMANSPTCIGRGELSDSEGNRGLDTTHDHRSHLLDPGCQICTATMGPPVKSRLRRSKECWMASPDCTADTADEITSHLSKYFSPMENRAASVTSTNSAVGHRRSISRKRVVWRGFIQTSTVKRFLVKAYPVLGPTDLLAQVLSTVIAVRRCVLPDPVWESVDKLAPSKTKETCVVCFKPVSKGDLELYTSYYSYLNSQQRYGLVLLEQCPSKTVYLVPLPALQKLPSRLPPLSGPGLESSHPDLLLAIAFSKTHKSADALRKPYDHGRKPKSFAGLDKQYVGDHSRLPTSLAKPGDKPHLLPMIPYAQQGDQFHPPVHTKPPGLLLGDIWSNEELLPCADLSNISAAEIFQPFYNDMHESGGTGNSPDADEWEIDGLDENVDTNEQYHGVVSRKGNESRSANENVDSNQNLLAQFKPEDASTENILLGVTQLNLLFQQEDGSVKESDIDVNEHEGVGVVSAQCGEDTATYLAELNKLFTSFPLSTLSQPDAYSHFPSTIPSCAEILNHLLSAGHIGLQPEEQVPTFPNEAAGNVPADSGDPQHVDQLDCPPSLTPQMPDYTQHLGRGGRVTAENALLPHAVTANAATMQRVDLPCHSGANDPFPFRFTSCSQRGTYAEPRQAQEQQWSALYCPSRHLHCAGLRKDSGQSQEHSQHIGAAVMEPHTLQNNLEPCRGMGSDNPVDRQNNFVEDIVRQQKCGKK